MPDLTGAQVSNLLMDCNENLRVVTSDDPDDGFNFWAGDVKTMFLSKEGILHETLGDLESEGETFEEKVIVILP